MPRIRYWAAARDRAGTTEEQVAAGRLSEVLAAVGAAHAMTDLLERCVLLVDGEQVRRDDDPELVDSSVLEVLPPYAGGAA